MSARRRSSKRNGEQEFAEEGAVHPRNDCKVLTLEPHQSHQGLLSEVVAQVTRRRAMANKNSPKKEQFIQGTIVKLTLEPHQSHQGLLSEVVAQVTILNSSLSLSQSDRLAANRAAHLLSQLAENELIVNSIVECRAVPALLKHLKAPELGVTKPYEHEVEEGCVSVLALLAKKQPQHQQLIVDAGALAYLMDLLKSHKTCGNSPALTVLLRSAANAIKNLAAGNSSIKTRVRMEGGIPPLVQLFEFDDSKLQGAAAGALGGLAFKNDENKSQILKFNVLPTLVPMLVSEDATIHCEAVTMISNLAQYSPNITKKVLLLGALRPVIILLRSCCSESKKEAARLIGIFARTASSDCKVHIAQRGAIPPLIDMLKSPHAELQEMSAFAISILVEDPHNQVGIAYNGGIEPLLNLLSSKNTNLQHHATYSVYCLADNEENVAVIVKFGVVQKLLYGDFTAIPAKKIVGNTLELLKKKMHGRKVLKQLLYLMRFGEEVVQRHVALALAHLCSPDDQKFIFVDNNGLSFLLDLLTSRNLNKKREASMALHSLAIRTTSISPLDTTPPSSTTLKDISLGNVSQLYELSESTNDMSLRRACILFLLEQFDKLRVKPWYAGLMCRIFPDVKEFFKSLLARGTDN